MAYQPPVVLVLFGRAGAGKTTIAEFAKAHDTALLLLDLDVCIPTWMKDNFVAGIYPTLEQRQQFAVAACDHVEQGMAEAQKERGDAELLSALVSFSFVNTDLRDTFRLRFPQAKWILVDTSEEEAQRRLDMREGHFYKGKVDPDNNDSPRAMEGRVDNADAADNSEWDFAPVTFPHVILDGNAPVQKNADEVLALLKQTVRQARDMSGE